MEKYLFREVLNLIHIELENMYGFISTVMVGLTFGGYRLVQ